MLVKTHKACLRWQNILAKTAKTLGRNYAMLLPLAALSNAAHIEMILFKLR
jgi:hypothetical protein